MLALTIMLAGCGGGRSADSSTSRLSRPRFTATADHICAHTRAKQLAAQAQVRHVVESNAEGGTDPQVLVASLYNLYARALAGQNHELRALGQAPGPSDLFDRFLARSDQAVSLLKSASDAAGSGDSRRSDATDHRAQQAASQALAAARQYGLKVCGHSIVS